MNTKNSFLAIGVMTGNSVDGIDVVLTAFHNKNAFEDLCNLHVAFSEPLYQGIRALQKQISLAAGDIDFVSREFSFQGHSFDTLHKLYIETIAKAVAMIIAQARSEPELSGKYDLCHIDVIGFHGQTCGHHPPSKSEGFDPTKVFTLQIGSGKDLADITGITVINDFRSDDIMAGGEGAPFAPVHNKHLVATTKNSNLLPIAFINAGNSSNLAIITSSPESQDTELLGWDAGPCNHFCDLLTRTYFQKKWDENGKIGATGKINMDLLESLFHSAIPGPSGKNYLLLPPPKSADPSFYVWPSQWHSKALSPESLVRTAEYFSAYIIALSLDFVPEDLTIPNRYALFGGGWKNPLIEMALKDLLGNSCPPTNILPEHCKTFERIRRRIKQSGELQIHSSDTLGFGSQPMEARIFADMARCRLLGIPFTYPSTTGVRAPTVGGVIRFPGDNLGRASRRVQKTLEQFNSLHITGKKIQNFDHRWSRAAAGWSERIK